MLAWLQVLLDAGADVCAADEEGWTPLHCAVAARWLPGWKETWTGSGPAAAPGEAGSGNSYTGGGRPSSGQQHQEQKQGEGDGAGPSSALGQQGARSDEGEEESDQGDHGHDITLCPHKLLRLEARRLEVIKLLVGAARRAGAMSAATALNAQGASPVSLYTLEATARVTRLKESLSLLPSLPDAAHGAAVHQHSRSSTPEVQVGGRGVNAATRGHMQLSLDHVGGRGTVASSLKSQ